MDAHELALVAEVIEILADGLRRDGEFRSQFVDHHASVRLGDVENLLLARRQEHRPPPDFVFTGAQPIRGPPADHNPLTRRTPFLPPVGRKKDRETDQA